MPGRAYQSGNPASGNPAIKQSCNPSPWHSPLSNKPMLPVNLQFRFQFQQIFAPKNMPAAIYQLHWYPTGSRGFGYELDLVGFGLGGLNRKQSTCLVSIAHSNVCICMWLPVCCCCCSALLCSRPFVSPSFVQSFNRKLYCLTHIYLRPPHF